jgi:hypothetical protein
MRERLQRSRFWASSKELFLLAKSDCVSQVYSWVSSDRNPNQGCLWAKGLQYIGSCTWLAQRRPSRTLRTWRMSLGTSLSPCKFSLCWLHSLTVQMDIVNMTADSHLTPSSLIPTRKSVDSSRERLIGPAQFSWANYCGRNRNYDCQVWVTCWTVSCDPGTRNHSEKILKRKFTCKHEWQRASNAMIPTGIVRPPSYYQPLEYPADPRLE